MFNLKEYTMKIKSIFNKKILIAIATISSLSLQSCLDDDDNTPEIPNSPKVLYNLKAQSCQSEIVTIFIDMVDSGKLKLLEKRQDCDFEDREWDKFDDNVRPFMETDAFIEEAANLKMKHLNNGGITIDKVVKKIDKDRVSAMIYMLWYVNKFAQEIDNSDYDYATFIN